MAEGKKSFVLYSDLMPTIKKIVEKDRVNKTNNAGELFLHLLGYVCDLDPEPINDTVDFVFEPIKTQLKRDLVKWEKRSERSRENGSKGGRPPKQQNPQKPEETQQVFLEPKKPDSVIMCNSVLSDSVNDILLKKETKEKFNFKNYLIGLGIKKQLVEDWLKVRKTKKLTNTETAFNNLKIEFEKSGKDLNEIINHCVTQSWGGFKASWKWEESGPSQNQNSEKEINLIHVNNG